MKRKLFAIIASVVMLVGILFPSCTPADTKKSNDLVLRPMVFVHGYSGSASQFKTEALRFASNGYPANYVRAFEYDSTMVNNTTEQIRAGIDELIAPLLEETGAEQVDLLGHSMGTSVCQGYLNSSPERAAKVAHYVNLDGSTATSLPGGVPTLAIWGRGSTTRQIVGATNVYFVDHTHTDVVTWAGSFVEMYKFFTGQDPVTTDIVPEPPDQVRLAGRVHFAQTNLGVPGSTLEIWEIDGDTGARIGKKPAAVYQIGEDGAWGPFKAKGGAHYEYCLLREGVRPQHMYTQPPIRSDYLVRIGTTTVNLMDTSDVQSNLTVGRNKEFWGDQPGNNDTLLINGVNIINAATAPSLTLTSLVIAMLVYDKDSDRVSDTTKLISYPYPFVFGVDLFIPGADPPNGTISVVLYPRGGGRMQMITVPNWASSGHSITIGFNDYVQDINSWVEYVQAK
jgi:pimeloyl-ACP methyl ester carboxylesterase